MRKILACLLLMVSGGVIAQDETISPDLIEQIEILEQDTETIRGLEALETIAIDFPTRNDVLSYLEGVFDDYYTPEAIEEELAFYKAFGLIPDDYDLVPELQAILGEQVAGYYDTETQVMNVILSGGGQAGDYLPFLDRVIYAHEYVHALQDQHFDLDAFYLDVEMSENVDALLARQALVEGDATAVMNIYTQIAAEANPLGTLLELGLGIAQIGNVTLPANTPRIINQELTFPYLTGEQFVRALYAVDGWETVNAAYGDNPPLSTEHILHPRSYLEGDNPIAVSLDDGSHLLGEGWSLARSGVFGEFYLREWLFTAPEIDSDLVVAGAMGWAGDAYHIYQHEDGSYSFELHIVWDSEAEAAEFYYETVLDFGNRSYAFPAPLSIYTRSQRFCWALEADVLCVAIEGNKTIIVNAPEEQQPFRLFERE